MGRYGGISAAVGLMATFPAHTHSRFGSDPGDERPEALLSVRLNAVPLATSLGQVITILARDNLTGLLVVEQERLVGLVTECDADPFFCRCTCGRPGCTWSPFPASRRCIGR